MKGSARASQYGRSARNEPSRRTSCNRPRGRSARRRRLRLLILIAALLGLFFAVKPFFQKAVHEITLPLHHADIIRQQAARRKIDPALIAAVIYAESRFHDQTSKAGAKGLMQILPSTADYIARKSGGKQFEHGDLATPQINIQYGTFYLRYLLDRYNSNEALALAAYNAGEGKLDGWIAKARQRGHVFRAPGEIPIQETRNYVDSVLRARERYRAEYARELGLARM